MNILYSVTTKATDFSESLTSHRYNRQELQEARFFKSFFSPSGKWTAELMVQIVWLAAGGVEFERRRAPLAPPSPLVICWQGECPRYWPVFKFRCLSVVLQRGSRLLRSLDLLVYVMSEYVAKKVNWMFDDDGLDNNYRWIENLILPFLIIVPSRRRRLMRSSFHRTRR